MDESMENKKVQLTEKFLQETIDRFTSTLVGRLLKKVEIINNPSILKSVIKEQVYEEGRNFRDTLIAFSLGYESNHFVFKAKENK